MPKTMIITLDPGYQLWEFGCKNGFSACAKFESAYRAALEGLVSKLGVLVELELGPHDGPSNSTHTKLSGSDEDFEEMLSDTCCGAIEETADGCWSVNLHDLEKGAEFLKEFAAKYREAAN